MGKYMTITAAITAAKSGDKILVHPGTYTGLIDLNGKAISLTGITGKASDVVVTRLQDQYPALQVRNHPTGLVSRFDSLTIALPPSSPTFVLIAVAIDVNGGSGTVVFHNCNANERLSIQNLKGTVALTSCIVRVAKAPLFGLTGYVAQIHNTSQAFVHGCTFDAQYLQYFNQLTSTLDLNNTVLEMCRTSVTGATGQTQSRWSWHGGVGVSLTNARARFSGRVTDRILGGNGGNYAGVTYGGPGVYLVSSTLQWSGLTIQGGTGGKGLRAPILGAGATVMNPIIPIVSPRSQFAVGAQTMVDLKSTPGAVSITWVSAGLLPLHTPFGILAIDLAQNLYGAVHIHDAKGLAAFNIDLRFVSQGSAGLHFGLQTVALTPSKALMLSSPWIGILGQ